MEETGWHLWNLREGDQVRIFEDGPEVAITRVSESAAYYKTFQENTYEVFDSELGDLKEITKRKTKVSYIAPRSFVEMIKRGPKPAKSSEWVPPKEEAETAIPKSPKPRPELPPVKYKKVRRRR